MASEEVRLKEAARIEAASAGNCLNLFASGDMTWSSTPHIENT